MGMVSLPAVAEKNLSVRSITSRHGKPSVEITIIYYVDNMKYVPFMR